MKLVRYLPQVAAQAPNTKENAAIVVNGKTVQLGSFVTSSKGELSIPAFSAAKAGTYTVVITGKNGKQSFLQIKVSAK